MVSILSSTDQRLSELLNTLPKRTMIKDKISAHRGADVLEYIKKKYLHEKLDLTDGVKIIRKNSWALVRASGTEPIIRIIIDSEYPDHSQDFYAELMNHISAVNKK